MIPHEFTAEGVLPPGDHVATVLDLSESLLVHGPADCSLYPHCIVWNSIRILGSSAGFETSGATSSTFHPLFAGRGAMGAHVES